MTEDELNLLRGAFGVYYTILHDVESLPDYYGKEYSNDLYMAVEHLGEILNVDLSQKM